MPPVFVQVTSPHSGPVAVFLLAGEGAAAVVARCAASRRAAALPVGGVVHTALRAGGIVADDAGGGAAVDDALVIRVGGDRFELHTHGGVAVVAAVTAALEAAGAVRRGVHEAAAAGLLGDPLTAEVALALPAARTMTAVRLLTHQRGAGVGRWAEEWRAWLAAAPRGAGDLWPLHTTAQWLLARSAALRRLLDPPRVAIVGAPNAGKSTLANALLGRMVSIASDVPGTTRDWVEAPVHLAGANGIEVAVTLVDTAGVRATTDPLERESIRRTEAQARAADVVVVVVDATRPWSVGEWDRLTGDDQPVVVVLNKWDLVTAGEARGADEAGVVHLSALRQTGLEGLMTAVLGQLDLADVHPEEPFVFSARQRALVEELAVARDPETCGALLGGLAGRAAADPLPPAPRDTMPA